MCGMFNLKLFVFITVLYSCTLALKCGQTDCPAPGKCCMKNQTLVDSGKCCCTQDSPGSFRFSCSESTSFPWWGVLIIVLIIGAIAGGVGFWLYRRRRRNYTGMR